MMLGEALVLVVYILIAVAYLLFWLPPRREHAATEEPTVDKPLRVNGVLQDWLGKQDPDRGRGIDDGRTLRAPQTR